MLTRTQTPSIVAPHKLKICHWKIKMRWPPQMLLGIVMPKNFDKKYYTLIPNYDHVTINNVTETSRRRPFLLRFWTRLAMVARPPVGTLLMKYPGRRRLIRPAPEPTWRNRTLQVRYLQTTRTPNCSIFISLPSFTFNIINCNNFWPNHLRSEYCCAQVCDGDGGSVFGHAGLPARHHLGRQGGLQRRTR